MASFSSINNASYTHISSLLWKATQDHHHRPFRLTISKSKWPERHGTKRGFSAFRIFAEKSEIDFSDPDWKTKYQKEFESRFNLPHLKDILDVQPRPTTFSLMDR